MKIVRFKKSFSLFLVLFIVQLQYTTFQHHAEPITYDSIQIVDVSPKNESNNVGLIPFLTFTINSSLDQDLLVECWSNESGFWNKFFTNHTDKDTTFQIYYRNFSKINTIYHWSVNISNEMGWKNRTFWFKSQNNYFEKKWETKIDYYSWSPLVAEDIDNDGSFEIFIGGRNGSRYTTKMISDGFVCIDGLTGFIEWNKKIDFDGLYIPCAIDDLDNDGTFEIVHASGDRTIAHNCEDGSEFWNVSLPSAWGQIAIARFDDNMYPYVYVGSNSVHENNPSIKKIFGNNGTLAASNSIIKYTCHGGISIADLNSDGDFEIIISDSDNNFCFNEDLELLWKTNPYSSESHAAIITDVCEDNRLEVIFLEQDHNYPANGGIHVYYANGSEVEEMNDGSIGLACHSQPSVCDIDTDGNIEVLTSKFITNFGATPIQVWDLNNWELDTILEKSSEPPNCANIIGDEHFEILSCAAFTDSDSDIYDTNFSLIASLNDYGTSTLTQDIDGDGLNEIVFNKPIWTDTYDYGLISAWDTTVPCQNQRSDTSHYSERRTSVAEYIPKIGKKCILSNYLPDNNASEISINVTQLTVYINEPNGDNIYWTIETNPHIGYSNGSLFENGSVFCPIFNLSYDTIYEWYVNCSDGTNWINEKYFFTTEKKTDHSGLPQQKNNDLTLFSFLTIILLGSILTGSLFIAYNRKRKNR